MYLHITYSVLDNCRNLENSYGEICVKCNKCGRFNEDKPKPTTDENITKIINKYK